MRRGLLHIPRKTPQKLTGYRAFSHVVQGYSVDGEGNLGQRWRLGVVEAELGTVAGSNRPTPGGLQ